MKILIIAGGFFPAQNYGGPVVSVNNLCSLLHEQFEMYVIAADHDLGESNRMTGITDGWNCRPNCKVYYLKKNEYTLEALNAIYKSINPDVLYINSLFDYSLTVPFLKIAKKCGGKVLLAPRGQLCSGAFVKKYKKFPYIVYLKLRGLIKDIQYQTTSEEETQSIIKYLGAKEEQIHFLTNIPTISEKSSEDCVEKKDVGTGKFVFLSRIHPKKNLVSALEILKNVNGNVIYDIYGPKEDKEYWEKCLKTIAELPSNIHVNYCGTVTHEEVHSVFKKYDAFLFPTLSENYGHVIAESLSSGIPVIISDQTPWRELEQNMAGWDISLDDKQKWQQAIEDIIYADEQQIQRMRSKAYDYFCRKSNLEEIKSTYYRVFSSIK
ncbi:MAG: glycosyltransferase family 4 protein [Lachnospiraceae bacterium]|nr:glycosyltransferase family 4 protein [Lachnospiraceae bacterium]